MASSDMDPVFKRALRLLHSKSSDAEEQLRMMLDDAIKQSYGSEKTLTNYLNKKELSNKQGSPRKAASGSGRKEDRKDTDKKRYEKLNESGTGESSRESSGVKKKSGSDIKKSSHSKQLLMQSSTPLPEKLPLTSVSKPDDHEEEDLALEMLEDDLRCVICRGMDVGARNQMVECMECKSLYHQECHQPPVAFTEINDPRSAWYCANCTEAINKRGASSSNLEKHTSGLNLTGIPNSDDMKPTTATSATKSSSPSSASSSTFESMSQASAKPLSSSSSSSKSMTSATSSSKLVTPNINIINAEKKLQTMKKKAAKQQEKRKFSK